MWRVPSLPVPQHPESLALDEALTCAAVRLFVERATAASPFTLTRVNAAAVTDICRRLDGIPLAIELAAARVNILTPEQISARLQDRLRLLTGGRRTVVARQRTLEAAVDWSYELLTEAERRLLARLSVFSGGWTLEAAEKVCSGEGIEPYEVLDLLSRLLDKSLVIVEEPTGADRRYRFLETMRQYGRDRLFGSGEVTAVSERHFGFFLDFARRAEPELVGPDQPAWLDRLELEHDNLGSAMDWGMAAPDRKGDALRLATPLSWFWTKRGYFTEGRQRLEGAIAGSGGAAPELETQALTGLIHLVLFQGDAPACHALVARSLATARHNEDLWAEAFALGMSAILESDRGNFDTSMALAREARDVALRSRHRFARQPLALALRMLAYGALQGGDLPQAGVLFEEAIALQREVQETWSLGILLSDLAAHCGCSSGVMQMQARSLARRWASVRASGTAAALPGACRPLPWSRPLKVRRAGLRRCTARPRRCSRRSEARDRGP